jgi:hypothetical protein
MKPDIIQKSRESGSGIILNDKRRRPGRNQVVTVKIGKVVLWMAALSKPLEFTGVARCTPNVLVSVDSTEDLGSDLVQILLSSVSTLVSRIV